MQAGLKTHRHQIISTLLAMGGALDKGEVYSCQRRRLLAIKSG
jgi:hypothetical protein